MTVAARRTDARGRRAWGAGRVLDAWSACEMGAEPIMPAIGYPTRRRRDVCGGEILAHWRVVSLPGYRRARPVLVHRLVYGRPLDSFEVRRSGETLEEALSRLNWQDLRIYATRSDPRTFFVVPEAHMAAYRWETFLAMLEADLEREPYFGAEEPIE